MSPASRIAVIGAGTMGHGIAYVAALSGCRVALIDASGDALARAMERIRASFDRAIERGKLSPEDRDFALARIRQTGRIEDGVADAHVVIEAVPERLDLKQRVLGAAEDIISTDALLASNTSSLSITQIASVLRRPERAIGLHFFNPVPVMKLLEVVRGLATDDATVATARELAAAFGKTPIVVRDTPGFATSRLGVVLGLEAMRMVEQNVASAEDIDRAMELGYNHPMGPLRLTDLVGLDVRLAIAEHLHATLKDDTYRPPDVLRRLVAEGKLGKKSGQGFYSWENER